ncbi:MAG: hypothetical protein GX025_06345 [Clostridiales bacterium]|nr:hypothetical protein [Clostridiales bacterium]
MQPLVTKLRFWMTPAFWTTTVFTKIRQFLSNLLDIKPKHKKDYYGIGRYLISKRLAFSIVIALGIVCTFYISAILPAKAAGSSVPSYKYNSVALKFYDGTVNILAADGHLAYTGQVEKGKVSGTGKLFDKENEMLYEGLFENNLYNGMGKLYYSGGSLKYEGEFSDNLYNGTGKLYRGNGTSEYTGQFSQGLFSGEGVLYGFSGETVYTGSFLSGGIVFSELPEKTTAEISSMYTGKSTVYSSDREYCVMMDDIGAMYSAKDGSNTLDGQWQAETIYILSEKTLIAGTEYDSIDMLATLMGSADYYGTVWINLPEAICINSLYAGGNETIKPVSVTAASELDSVYLVSGYDENATVYLYTFVYDGLTYTFYCNEAGANNFFMYSIQSA